MIERTRGLYTRENAGISSENYVRIIMAENLRFLGEGSSAQGKPGAKARPKGVVDARHIEIAEPGRWLTRAKGTEIEGSRRCSVARKGSRYI